jgi:hypothetical protein
MSRISHKDDRQGVFWCLGRVEDGGVCVCFHGRLDGLSDGSQPLMCDDAPWACPRTFGPFAENLSRNPGTCNTRVRND